MLKVYLTHPSVKYAYDSIVDHLESDGVFDMASADMVLKLGAMLHNLSLGKHSVCVDGHFLQNIVTYLIKHGYTNDPIFFVLCAKVSDYQKRLTGDRKWYLNFDCDQGGKISNIKAYRTIIKDESFKDAVHKPAMYPYDLRLAKAIIEAGASMGPMTRKDAEYFARVGIDSVSSATPAVIHIVTKDQVQTEIIKSTWD